MNIKEWYINKLRFYEQLFFHIQGKNVSVRTDDEAF